MPTHRSKHRLAESQRRILEIVSEDSSATINRFSSELGISDTAVDKNLASLKSKGLLARVGPDRGGTWSVTKEGSSHIRRTPIPAGYIAVSLVVILALAGVFFGISQPNRSSAYSLQSTFFSAISPTGGAVADGFFEYFYNETPPSGEIPGGEVIGPGEGTQPSEGGFGIEAAPQQNYTGGYGGANWQYNRTENSSLGIRLDAPVLYMNFNSAPGAGSPYCARTARQ